MTSRISAALAATLLAAFGLLSSESKPNPIEAARLNNLGVAYMNQQLFEKGLKEFQQSADADPKLAIARLNVGIAYLNLQKIDEAKAALEGALKQDPKNPNAWYSLGMLAKNMGDAQAAIDAFKRVIEIDANDADTWYFLGTAYVQAKQFPQAIEAFQHALQLNPIHASAEFGLSRAYQQSSDTEHAREHLKKFQYLTQNKISAPMSLAYGEQGQYSRAVESPSAVLKAPAPIKVRFVDVSAEAGVAAMTTADPKSPLDIAGTVPNLVGYGACFLDYDGDGRPDLFVADRGKGGGLALYHNLGNGRFEDVTRKAGLDPSLHATSCTAGDYDNDGFEDLVIGLDGRLLLEHNEKNGTFKDATGTSGIQTDALILGLTFIDYDHDGDIDLYVTRFNWTHQVSSDSGFSFFAKNTGSHVMWRNNGDGTFSNVTDPTGLEASGSAVGAIGTDYNNDRAVDIVLASAKGPKVFENPREGKFKPRQLVADPLPTFGVTIFDFDHDGWMDVAFTRAGTPALMLMAQ